MADHTPYQRKIIERYYKNFDAITFQRLSELATDLYLAEGKVATGSGVASRRVSGNWKYPMPASLRSWRNATRPSLSGFSKSWRKNDNRARHRCESADG